MGKADSKPAPKKRFSLARAGDFKLSEKLERGDHVKFVGTGHVTKIVLSGEGEPPDTRTVIVVDECDVKLVSRPPKMAELPFDDVAGDGPKPIPFRKPRGRPKGRTKR